MYFIPSENQSGVEQLKRSAVIATQNVARLHSELENEPDEFTCSRLLKLLLHSRTYLMRLMRGFTRFLLFARVSVRTN